MLPKLLEEQSLTVRKKIGNYANYSLVELTNLKLKLIELQSELGIYCQKAVLLFSEYYLKSGLLQKLSILLGIVFKN